tara:strand:- start:246 stop:593 length:348 start_codon:yes stop_codon:yes gene_type:complete
MSKIIKFPKESIRQNDSLDMLKKIRRQKEHYINNIVDQHCSSLLANIGLSGFKIDNEEFMKDFAFTVESVRSALYRNMGIHHEFHTTLDEMSEILDTEELSEEEQMSMNFENEDE